MSLHRRIIRAVGIIEYRCSRIGDVEELHRRDAIARNALLNCAVFERASMPDENERLAKYIRESAIVSFAADRCEGVGQIGIDTSICTDGLVADDSNAVLKFGGGVGE